MASERVQRQIDALLDEAEVAIKQSNWALVRDRAQNVLALDPGSGDAQAYLAAADRALSDRGSGPLIGASAESAPARAVAPEFPASFADGRYRVVRFLGEGGKKRVYLCHDTKLDREVAFSLIKTEGLDEEGLLRLQREAQAMARLGDHPHIVAVHDMGEEPSTEPGLSLPKGSGRGQPYLVSQFMPGGDVEGLIERAEGHRVQLEVALRIADEVCRGLGHAHSHGIVHRDLKPGNVWLTADGTANLGDFGLAMALDRSRLTQAGMMVGTVSYMPPEQASGAEVTPRSDLYSLGCMLYEMVCGRPPFVGDEAVAIIGQHLNTPPVAPTWHRPDCPPGLEVLVLRLLEKDPGKRPESASEVRQALMAVDQAPTPAPPPILGEGTNARSPLPGLGEGLGVRATDNPIYRRTFVGREGELKQLHAAFDAALSGQAGLVMVVGEPGIGKTALCEQLATYVTLRGGKALVGHCYEEGSLSLPYLPFVEAMRSYVLARDPAGLKTDLGSGAAEVARIVSEIRDRLPVELRPPGDPEEERWRLLQAVSGFLRNASSVQPLLLVLEDLHDADRGTLDLLVHLSRNLEGARLLIAGTYRDVEVDRSHPLSGSLADLRRNRDFLRVPLRGLTAEEVQRMMASVAQRDIPWAFAELLHRQTEGNPLFVQEMLRYLVEEGLVAEQQGALRRVGDESLAGRIPEGLRDVIGKRLSRLAEKTNQVLSMAAVIGREFRLDVLQSVAALTDEEMDTALEQAQERAIVEQRSTVGALVFRFTHAFFRQTLYEEIFASRRLRLHQQVARALEQVYGRRVEDHAAELAEHFAQSTDPADLAKALHYSELAAQRAVQVFAYGEAARQLDSALKLQEVLDPDDASKRCDLLLALAEALLPTEEPGRVATAIAPEAFELAEQVGDGPRAARVAVLAAEALLRKGGPGEAGRSAEFRTWAERAHQHAPAESITRVYADVYMGLAFGGDRFERHRFLRRAADLAQEVTDDRTYYAAASWAVRYLQAAPDRATLATLSAGALTRPRDGVRPADLGVCLRFAGGNLLEQGDRAGAERAWRDLADLAGRTRDATLALWAREPAAILAFVDGRLEDAVVASNDLSSPLEVTLDLVPRALLYLGRTDAVPSLLDSWARGGRPREAALACFLAHLGQGEEARRIRGQFGDLGVEDESSMVILVHLLEASLLTKDEVTARELAGRLAPFARFPYVRETGGGYGRLLGGAAALLGEPEKAREYYLQAIEACEKIRFRPEIALTRLELAELILEHYPDEKPEAMGHLDFAIDEFRAMKMQPALERALRHKGLLKA